ncbi:Uncharacterized protein GBIM_04220 [Gryllus bimaculatus]|nr:Uncharacterized protein GBIM_04220 [Gryllus bimaculatus]
MPLRWRLGVQGPAASPEGNDRLTDQEDIDDNALSPIWQCHDVVCRVPAAAEPACAWCGKPCRASQLFSLRTPTGQKAFCSEVCFTQCRRANFKRNKTCDWCRHVRHTVNYVDFQDGEHQLQFCSDKCLNQYKMNIFCKETQAHLQLHPHLQDGTGAGGSGGLITPDLWLRDCRSSSPASDRSASPGPPSGPLPPRAEMRWESEWARQDDGGRAHDG